MHDDQDEPRQAVSFTRRRVLTCTGAAVALAFGTNLTERGTATAIPGDLRSDPFRLGIASGDPLSTAVVLWTRLVPELFDPLGGMPYANYPVEWQVAKDEGFRQVVRAGIATARPEYRHAVHVDVRGLEPSREYFYRFRAGRYLSPAGRTKTAPAGRVNGLNFGVASCQSFPSGYYTAYQHMVNEDLDVLFFLGDYIYEGAINAHGGHRADTSLSVPPIFETAPDTLDLYRLRYALYKSDPDLQAAHAAFPWIVTWDDHEVENNYAGAVSKGNLPTDDFLVRRANAYRAYWEHQPLRPLQEPKGPDARLYRRFDFGDLMRVSVLDTRQYRSDQACGDGAKAGCSDAGSPARTITGAGQMDWLLDGLSSSQARWNLIANQVMMAERRTTLTDPPYLSMDAWDGYTADRKRLFDGISERKAQGILVITGDTHANYACDLKRDFADQSSPTLGVEFVGTSITSNGDGSDTTNAFQVELRANPHMKFTNFQRGYVTCRLDRDRVRADFRILPYVTRRGAPVSTRASFVSERADPGLEAV
ncbi:MAG TPA: alkaline phosphatase D family protein [Amycolatopsis sp.]|uniref:alkaline phosphatase D family protein n=1 Tax=Amycolatopsis sp. TaxID=37632 RepID=UPI002B4A127C|nr:alkaline phosphatase D family protein [Amycolatopsis sp.]HKS49789.1 alkaline phosphatase D family protein [Amycolatopsis sp.]